MSDVPMAISREKRRAKRASGDERASAKALQPPRAAKIKIADSGRSTSGNKTRSRIPTGTIVRQRFAAAERGLVCVALVSVGLGSG